MKSPNWLPKASASQTRHSHQRWTCTAKAFHARCTRRAHQSRFFDFRGFERWRKGTQRKAAQMEEIRKKYEGFVAERVEEMERVDGVEI